MYDVFDESKRNNNKQQKHTQNRHCVISGYAHTKFQSQ